MMPPWKREAKKNGADIKKENSRKCIYSPTNASLLPSSIDSPMRVSTPHERYPLARTFAPNLLPRVPTHRFVLNIPCASILPPTRVYHQKCVCHLPPPYNYPSTSVFAPTHPRLPFQPCLPPKERPYLIIRAFTPNTREYQRYVN